MRKSGRQSPVCCQATNDPVNRTLTGITLPRPRRAKQRKRGCALVKSENLHRSLSLLRRLTRVSMSRTVPPGPPNLPPDDADPRSASGTSSFIIIASYPSVRKRPGAGSSLYEPRGIRRRLDSLSKPHKCFHSAAAEPCSRGARRAMTLETSGVGVGGVDRLGDGRVTRRGFAAERDARGVRCGSRQLRINACCQWNSMNTRPSP